MCKMIHKSQKTIKYYFFLKKKTFLGLIALKNHTKETAIHFILCNIYTHAQWTSLKKQQQLNWKLLGSLPVKVML